MVEVSEKVRHVAYSRWFRVGLLILFLVPFGFSFLRMMSPVSQQAIEGEEVRSSLVFNRYVVDRRRVDVARKKYLCAF